MHKYRVMNAVIMALAVLMFIPSCRSSKDVDTNEQRGAMSSHNQLEMMPPPVGEYEVLGVKEGLDKYIVKYDKLVYRGGEPYNDSAALSLRELGIKTIISITPTDGERHFCRSHGFTLVEIPFEKNAGPLMADLNRYTDTLVTGAGPFYIHCYFGTHRGGVLGVAYRVLVLGWNYEKALVEFGRLGGDLLEDHPMLEVVRRAQVARKDQQTVNTQTARY